jgi:hypothetical protein
VKEFRGVKGPRYTLTSADAADQVISAAALAEATNAQLNMD